MQSNNQHFETVLMADTKSDRKLAIKMYACNFEMKDHIICAGENKTFTRLSVLWEAQLVCLGEDHI